MSIDTYEVDILARIIRPEAADLPTSAAKALLRLRFDEGDRARMKELLAKNQDDALSATERDEIRGYEIVSHMLDLIHSKARRSIKKIAKIAAKR